MTRDKILEAMEGAKQAIENLRAAIEAYKAQQSATVDMEAFDAGTPEFRKAFDEALAGGNWTVIRKGDGYRSPMSQMAFEVAFSTVNRLSLYSAAQLVKAYQDGQRAMRERAAKEVADRGSYLSITIRSLEIE